MTINRRPVFSSQECIDCHEFKPGDLACAAVITLPLAAINRDINQNRAMLITFALVTAIVAMFASYAIVRYVIVSLSTNGEVGASASA